MGTSIRLIRRYVWLVDTIRCAGHITLEEINKKWLDEKSIRLENEGAIPERTFHRHKEAIADLFGIDILCNRFDGNTYYIDNEDALNQPTFTSWLFNGLALDNHLIGNKEIAEKILFEDVPGGLEHLGLIVEALTQNRILKLTHRRFNSADDTIKLVEPYGLKQSERRWYMLGKVAETDKILVFALDRIESLELTTDTFTPDSTIDIRSYFDEVVGVNVDDDFDCEKVVVRIYGKQRAYIDALPLHKSQKLIERTKEYSDYEYRLRPEYEFQREILGLGASAEVLSPAWLREEIAWVASEILKRYRDY